MSLPGKGPLQDNFLRGIQHNGIVKLACSDLINQVLFSVWPVIFWKRLVHDGLSLFFSPIHDLFQVIITFLRNLFANEMNLLYNGVFPHLKLLPETLEAPQGLQ